MLVISLISSALGYTQVCNNWLQLPAPGSRVQVGAVAVSGTQITVEAMINRTAPYTGGYLWAGDVVSKHVDPSNANYLLRPNSAEITTSNGYFLTPPICEIDLNKTYHIAMTYDGSTLKFYRNGFLMSQVAASGALYQNTFETWIGYYNAQLHNTSFIGYINDVRIWNVARTQAEIRAGMNVPIASPTTTPGLVANYLFNNTLNKQGNSAFDGTLGGSASVNATNPTCASFVADSCFVDCVINEDFNFSIDPCDALNATFTSTSTTHDNIRWLFGDGTENTGQNPVSHLYPAAGNYTVSMILTLGSCVDTITKSLQVGATFENLILTPDTTICAGTTKQIRTKPTLSYCWFPTTFLDNPNSPNPITSTPNSMTYYFTATSTGTNLITNGDFSSGNTGFTSAYNFVANNVTEGEYFVGTNPSTWNIAMSSCGDHTSGSGNMMMLNGSPVPNVGVWTQTITVTPNTNYAFSTWIQALWPPNPAQLSFSINGRDIGSNITASLPTCTWTQFYTTWNSGNSTTATISIVNKNTLVQGNDFALDDISFAPVFIRRDSVVITVERPVVTANRDTTVCTGGSVQLSASGAASYLWSPGTDLSSVTISNPVARPTANRQYIVTGTSVSGCTAKDTINVTLVNGTNPAPLNDTLVCANVPVQLTATGGVTYKWTPSPTLSNPSIANPVVTPTATTSYFLEMTDMNSCIIRDTVRVAVRNYPVFAATPDTSVCAGGRFRLRASGGDQYQWSPSTGMDNSTSATPMVNPVASTTYTVLINDNSCHNDTTINVNVTLASSPSIRASKIADIDCQNPTTQLMATGGVSYNWSPAIALDNSQKANPIASIDSSTTFVLTGVDQNGCTGTDTITVLVSKAGMPIFELPNAFTPNNDGKNDCFGIRRWGNVEVLQMSIFNRWGQMVFQSKNPGACWYGDFNGVKQPAGGYTYIIRARSFCGEISKKGIVMLLR